MKSGERLGCTACAVEVIVLRVPTAPVELSCSGAPLVALSNRKPGEDGTHAAPESGMVLGKRYMDVGSGLELLCTRSGAGAVAANGAPLTLKESQPLPSSD